MSQALKKQDFSHKISKAICSIKNSYTWKLPIGATRWLRNTYSWNSYKLLIGTLQQLCYHLLFTGIIENSFEILTTGLQNGELIWWIPFWDWVSFCLPTDLLIGLSYESSIKNKISFNSFFLSQNIQSHLLNQEFIFLKVFNRNTFGILINFQLEKPDGFGNCLGVHPEFFQNSTRHFSNSLTILLLSAFH